MSEQGMQGKSLLLKGKRAPQWWRESEGGGTKNPTWKEAKMYAKTGRPICIERAGRKNVVDRGKMIWRT